MDGRSARAAVPHGWTHSQDATRRNGKRRPTARRRGAQQLPPRRSGPPEPGLRPVHDPRPFWEQYCSSHVQQNGLLSHPQDLDALLRVAAQRKINSYRQQYADKQNISFSLPLSAQAHACTASFCVFFFYRPTGRPRRTSLPLECHRNAINRTRFVSSARHSTSR